MPGNARHRRSFWFARIAHSVAAAAVTLAAVPATAETVTAWRLFVSDLDGTVVRAIDAQSRAVLGTFAIPAGAALQAGASTAVVYAIDADAGSAMALATGIVFDDHGDHYDIAITEPAAIAWTITTGGPLRTVASGGRVAFFSPADGTARIVQESALAANRATARVAVTSAPHDGIAAALANHLVLSVPAAASTAIRVLDSAGRRVTTDRACPDIAAAAPSAVTIAVVCGDEVLIVAEAAGQAVLSTVPLPAGIGPIDVLRGAPGAAAFAAPLPGGVLFVLPGATPATRFVPLPSAVLDVAIAPAAGSAFALTADGVLYAIAIADASAEVFATTLPLDRGSAVPRGTHRLAFVAGLLAVTDPRAGEVRLFDPATRAPRGWIEVAGTPLGIVAAGGSAKVH